MVNDEELHIEAGERFAREGFPNTKNARRSYDLAHMSHVNDVVSIVRSSFVLYNTLLFTGARWSWLSQARSWVVMQDCQLRSKVCKQANHSHSTQFAEGEACDNQPTPTTGFGKRHSVSGSCGDS